MIGKITGKHILFQKINPMSAEGHTAGCSETSSILNLTPNSIIGSSNRAYHVSKIFKRHTIITNKQNVMKTLNLDYAKPLFRIDIYIL